MARKLIPVLATLLFACGEPGVDRSKNAIEEGAPACPGTLSACGSEGSCTDTQTDSNNCGVCGKVCEGGGSCYGGSCSGDSLPCTPELQSFGAQCPDTNSQCSGSAAEDVSLNLGSTYQFCTTVCTDQSQCLGGTQCVNRGGGFYDCELPCGSCPANMQCTGASSDSPSISFCWPN